MNIKEYIKGIIPKKKDQSSEYRIRKTLTDSARKEANQKLVDVMNEITSFESSNNVKVLSSAKLFEEDYIDEDSINLNRIDFNGVSGTRFSFPLAVFMALPQKRIVLCLTRAFMIGSDRPHWKTKKPNKEQMQRFHEKIKHISNMMHEIEDKVIGHELSYFCIVGDNERDYASFYVRSNMLSYDIPYEIFMALPPKELVVEIMKALTIEFNEYENQ